MKRAPAALAVTAMIAALGLSACGGDDSAGDGKAGSSNAKFDIVKQTVVNPSDRKGGTLRFGHTSDLDSPDPGNQYYAHAWNFSRLYARTLLTFKMAPGQAEMVPDLAEAPGKPTDGGKTWTYKLKQGVKYHDGSEVTATDIKYAVARSNWGSPTISLGPTYFRNLLVDDGYKGPYKDKNLDHFKGISTPDKYTLVFHLAKPFGEFDYLATIPQTAPVPQAKDTGAEYYKTVMSTGPYKIDSWEKKKHASLSKNPHWDPVSDPNRKQLADKIEATLGLDKNELDARLLAGTIDVNIKGTGLIPASRAKVLANPKLKANSDNPETGFMRYMGINTKVPPFNNIHCRLAVQYATDRKAIQSAIGGPIAGEIATTVLPRDIPGYKATDVLPNGPDQHGDIPKAKAELTACGQPNGFSTTMIYRSDTQLEKAAAEATEQILAKVGIKLTIKGFLADGYTGNQAGSTNFLHSNKVGLIAYGWGPDFTSGYGFLQQIVDGRAIKTQGNSNIFELDDKNINGLIDKAAATTDPTARDAIYTQIDEAVMKQAVYVPWVYEKQLSYRSPNVTNWWFNKGYLQLDFATLGKINNK